MLSTTYDDGLDDAMITGEVEDARMEREGCTAKERLGSQKVFSKLN